MRTLYVSGVTFELCYLGTSVQKTDSYHHVMHGVPTHLRPQMIWKEWKFLYLLELAACGLQATCDMLAKHAAQRMGRCCTSPAVPFVTVLMHHIQDLIFILVSLNRLD